jgi:adenylylsulfate kinase
LNLLLPDLNRPYNGNFNIMISRSEKENFLKQKAVVIWLTGLSGSGKTTLAIGLEKALLDRGYFAKILDGDHLRSGINRNLGFSDQDREENIRRVAEISKLFLECGIICIASFISPSHAMRQMAKSIIGAENFIEIYLKASLEICEKRDPKGLYKAARNGEIANFTGIASPYEVPVNPDLVIDTAESSIEESLEICLRTVLPGIAD